MKKILTFVALGAMSSVFAGQNSFPYQNSSENNVSSYNDGNDSRKESFEYQSQEPYHQMNSQSYQQQSPGMFNGRQQMNDDLNRYQQQNSRLSDNRQPMNNEMNRYQKDDTQKSYTDQELRKKIQDALSSGWFTKGYESVSFDVNYGNVVLKGSVDSLENKSKVQDQVKKIEGVRQVTNEIKVQGSSDPYSNSQVDSSEKKYPQDIAATPEDRQLNAKIRDKLTGWFSNDYKSLVLRTTNGVVVLNGTVDKIEDKEKINKDIKDIPGVKSFDNQLTIIRR